MLVDFVPEGPLSMADCWSEPANVVDAQTIDDWSSAHFTWAIENFSKLNTEKLYSEVFYAGGYKWRVLLFPKNNNVGHLSMYLDAADSSSLPNGWSVYARLSLAVASQNHPKFTVRKDTQHQFVARESDWGFTDFIPLRKLYDTARGYLLNDTLIVETDVAVRTHVNNCSHRSRDSKKIVRFRSLEKPKKDKFSLKLSKYHTYDYVVERVAQHLDLDDPSKIRLTSHNCHSQQPKPQPIKYQGVESLSDMLVHDNQTSNILYYEVLDIPLPELQGLKTLEVAFHHATKDEVVVHTIRFSKRSTVGDVISDIKTKVKLSRPNAEVRLLHVFNHKIYKIFPLRKKIKNINIDQCGTLRAEEIPEEEKEIGPLNRLIHVHHFMGTAQNQKVRNFGEPFFLVIHEGETLAEVKIRMQKKLQVPDEEFSKWKFAFLSIRRPEYLQDTDILSTRFFQRRDAYGAWEQYLGIEHSDNPPKRSHSANQVRELALGHGTAAVEKKGIACICTSSGLKIVNVKDLAPSVEDDPESWRGFPVGKDHASLLHNAEVEHPDFFNDVKYSSARRAIQSLNFFASILANLASDKHGHLSRNDLQATRDELSDLERDGFRIRWAIEIVDRVFTVFFQLPLQQEITQLTAESTHLRGEIEHLQGKTVILEEEVASLKEMIEHKEEELVVAEKDMGEAELRLKEIASELETRGRLLAEYNSSLQ